MNELWRAILLVFLCAGLLGCGGPGGSPDSGAAELVQDQLPEAEAHQAPHDGASSFNLDADAETAATDGGVTDLTTAADPDGAEVGHLGAEVLDQQGNDAGVAPDVLDCNDDDPCTADYFDRDAGCQYVPLSGKPCDDGDICTTADTCTLGVCAGEPVDCQCKSAEDCAKFEDGNLCNGVPYCDTNAAEKHCRVDAGEQKQCDPYSGPEAQCRENACNPSSGLCGMVPARENLACDDGNPCTLGERCKAGACIGGLPNPCGDLNACTDDSCDPKTGCVNAPNQRPCDDGDECTQGDACSAGVCRPGTGTPACEDDNPCTSDRCENGAGCVHQNLSGVPCEDSDPCTGTGQCSDGACVAPQTCNDGDPCTKADTCQSGVCLGVLLSLEELGKSSCSCLKDEDCARFDDGDPCNGTVGCLLTENLGTCGIRPASLDPCNDGNPCTRDTCSAATGCSHEPLSTACNDGNPCTSGDWCNNGVCAGGKNTCPCVNDGDCAYLEDGNWCNGYFWCNWKKSPAVCEPKPDSAVKCQTPPVPICSEYRCEPKDGVCRLQAINDQKQCFDGNPCTAGDVCASGQCKAGGTAPSCDDGNPCTDDSCDPAVPGGCVHANSTRPCNDGNPCTEGDFCYDGSCRVTGQMKDCDDHNPCTKDSCSPLAPEGCVHTALIGDCDDGDPCTTGDFCSAGKCMAGKPVTACDDGNPCTYNDTCASGKCAGTAFACNTPGTCEKGPGTCSGAGVCTYPADTGAVCDDKNACTHTDKCQASKACVGTAYTCTTPGVCEKSPGTCGGNGTCTYTANTGAACDDKNACTHTDKCQATKTCTGTAFSCNGHGTCLGNNTCTCTKGFAGTYCDRCTAPWPPYPNCWG